MKPYSINGSSYNFRADNKLVLAFCPLPPDALTATPWSAYHQPPYITTKVLRIYFPCRSPRVNSEYHIILQKIIESAVLKISDRQQQNQVPKAPATIPTLQTDIQILTLEIRSLCKERRYIQK